MNQLQNFTKGFIKDNPVFVLLLGLCPTLGVTTTAINGLGMGLATTNKVITIFLNEDSFLDILYIVYCLFIIILLFIRYPGNLHPV